MRVRAPPVMRASSPPRATRTTSSMVRGSAPKITISHDYSIVNGEFRLVGLAADRVLHLHRDGVFAGVDGLLQIDPHRRGHVALGIERLRLFRRGLRLRPQHLAAGRDHRSHIADVDLVLRPYLKPVISNFAHTPSPGLIDAFCASGCVLVLVADRTGNCGRSACRWARPSWPRT